MEDFEQPEDINEEPEDLGDAEPAERTAPESKSEEKRRLVRERKRDQRQREKSLAEKEPLEETWKRNLDKLTDEEFDRLWARHSEAADIRFWIKNIIDGISAGLFTGQGMDDDSKVFMADPVSVYKRVMQHIQKYGTGNYPESLADSTKVSREFIDVIRYHSNAKEIMSREPEFWKYGLRIKMQLDSDYYLLNAIEEYVLRHNITEGEIYDLVNQHRPKPVEPVSWFINGEMTIRADVAAAYARAGKKFLPEVERQKQQEVLALLAQHNEHNPPKLSASLISENAERLRRERENGL